MTSEAVAPGGTHAAQAPRPAWLRPIQWLWVMRAWVAAFVGFALLGTTAYVLWAIKDLPDPSQSVLAAGDVVVLDRNGKLIEDWSPAGHYHVTLSLSQMGAYAPKAVLAAEDRSFYQHGAIDPTSTARAAWVDVTSRGLYQGGSTITQQLVKIQLLTPQKSITRKVQELVLAIALEQRYSKDQILTMYLNRVYFGHGAYGVGAAARTYFSKDAKDLTPAEAAFVAGLIQAPTAYDPVIHYDAAHGRELYVLQGMVATGALTQQQADEATREDVKSELHIQVTARQSLAPHFVDYVLTQLEAMFGSSAIQQGGIVVHTTLDLGIQQTAEQAVANGVQDLSYLNVNNSALLAAQPKTGEILAWVGSADYGNDSIGGQFDVVLSPRQPGSSFKPYVYEAALRDHKITWATVLHDRLTNFNGYMPRDFDNGGMGDIKASTAILYSRNIPAVQVGQMEGMNSVIDLAHQMGIKSQLQPYLSTAIGASDVTLYEHLQGYATFANQGQRVDLNVIKGVDDITGHPVFQYSNPSSTTVLTQSEAYLMSDVLRRYQDTWHFGWNRQMASKTGTSDNGKGGIPDSWIMAYNPDIAIGVWVGNTAPNGGGGLIRAYGENVGLTIMKRFINALPSNMRDWYSRPQGVVEGCAGDSQDPFLQGVCTQQATSPSASPSPSPSASPSGLPSVLPSILPSPSPSPTPPPASPTAPPSPPPSPTAPPAGASPSP
ncbi:MAG TPA: transglycosylase domain-containing protein [Candidatus Udaeobacter sp.]|nr:transglycosylase domain-containing protein [Candidatus Udaeobacter sp.]